jgi:hypothetical protein
MQPSESIAITANVAIEADVAIVAEIAIGHLAIEAGVHRSQYSPHPIEAEISYIIGGGPAKWGIILEISYLISSPWSHVRFYTRKIMFNRLNQAVSANYTRKIIYSSRGGAQRKEQR